LKKITEEKIEREIQAGRLGIARDRLHGLLSTYPEDLRLRSRLGDVYWLLGYPVEAGRFWFFDNPIEGDKQAAVDAFIRACRSDSAEILRRLKVHSKFKELEVEANAKLEHLLNEVGRSLPPREAPDTARVTSNALCFACTAIGISLLVLALIGLITVLTWVSER
jgi:hypothetical protein